MVMIIISVFYFFEQLQNPKALFIYNTFDFWIVTSILIYLAGTFFIFIFSSTMSREEFQTYWFINSIFNIIKNLLFGLAFYFRRVEKRNLANDKTYYYGNMVDSPV